MGSRASKIPYFLLKIFNNNREFLINKITQAAAAPDTGVEEECRPPVVVLVVVLLLDVFKVSGVRVGVKAGDGPPVGVEVFVVSLAADVVDAVVLLSAVVF